MTIIMYLSVILFWGITWYAVKCHLCVVSAEMSIVYRFFIASLIFFAWAFLKKYRLKFSFKEHLYTLSQGIFLFGLNYILFYHSTFHVTTGVGSIAFSTTIVFNILLGFLLFNNKVSTRVLIGALIGLTGLFVLFWPQLSSLSFSNSALVGILFSLGGTICMSFGQLLSSRNTKIRQMPLISTSAYGMLYGTIFTFIIARFLGREIIFDTSWFYIFDMIYLILGATVAAFYFYLTLINKIGPDKAAYALVPVPVVALTISAIFEDYQLTLPAFIAIVLVCVGNIIALSKGNLLPKKYSTKVSSH